MSELLWYLSRSTGVVAMCLMTAVLVLGLVTRGQRRIGSQRQALVTALHRWLALGVVAFAVVHMVSAIVDGFVDIGWLAMLVPFTSAYETWHVALGTLSVDLLAAVIVTSLLRHRLPEHVWRTVHLLSLAAWPIAIAHGLLMSTADQPLLRWATIACAVVGSGAIAWRFSTSYADRDTRRRITAQGWS